MNRRPPFSSARPLRLPGFFGFFFQELRTGVRTVLALAWAMAPANLFAGAPDSTTAAPALPDAGISLLRVTGALALVLGLFLAGAWLFKNWQRLSLQRGRQPKLNILESRSLGARQAVFVIAYERQRFLVATSSAGVNLLSHLPDTQAGEAGSVENPPATMSFAQALSQTLKRK